MIDPLIIYPINYCPNCQRNTIELYTWHNYPQKYAKMIEEFMLSGKIPDIDKYGIFTMRCNSCSKEYKIIWKDGFPYPEYGDFYSRTFWNKFRNDSILGRPILMKRTID